MTQLIGFAGYAQHGKDSCADVLVDHFGFVKIGFSDPIYSALQWIDPLVLDPFADHAPAVRLSTLVSRRGWGELKKHSPEVRNLLISLGESMRTYEPRIWIRQVEQRIDECRARGNPVVVTGVRRHAEREAIHAKGGIVIRVTNPRLDRHPHPVEDEVATMEVDYDIVNDGTLDDLRRKVLETYHEAVLQNTQGHVDSCSR